jgi:hypothetical protein
MTNTNGGVDRAAICILWRKWSKNEEQKGGKGEGNRDGDAPFVHLLQKGVSITKTLTGICLRYSGPDHVNFRLFGSYRVSLHNHAIHITNVTYGAP